MKHYKIFDHTADLGIEIYGDTLEDLFRHAADALRDLLLEADVPLNKSLEKARTLKIEGADSADLLVNFLRELLYLFNGDGLVWTSCRIGQVQATGLTVKMVCRPYDAKKDQVITDIKAVTYHQASVVRATGGWRGRVIFDV